MKWLLMVVILMASCHPDHKYSIFPKTKTTRVYIQPLGDISTIHASYVLSEVRKFHHNVSLLGSQQLPECSWYPPRKRFRADSVIAWLKDRVDKGAVVVGITNQDISTTKRDVKDFGVMGLGFCPGKACVASTFRLNKKRTREQLFKVVIHELGHTQGLAHCAVKTCFMRDAEGGNPADEEKDFCGKCKRDLIGKGWSL